MAEEPVKILGNCQVIRGFPFPINDWFNPKIIEGAMDYVPKDEDLTVVSYPKTGTTWMQYIVLQIVSRAESFPTFDDLLFKVMPVLEMSGTAAIEALECKPRIYKMHMAYNMVKKNNKAKYIYIYRHPEDTAVSYYHFLKNILSDDFEFDEFFECFLTGNIAYGSYFKHLLSFYEHREAGNILLVSYEKLHANRKEEILRIAKFIGEEYHESLRENEKVLNDVIEHTSFEYMKKNLSFTAPSSKPEGQDGSPAEKKTVNFFRKGIVGDGRNVLTDDQRANLKEAAQKILKGTSIIEEWYSK